jgi:hypothetical protein
MNDNQGLQQAIAAIKAGDKVAGRKLLVEFIRVNPRHENAVLWLSATTDDPAQKRKCFEQVLQINPDNQKAKAALARLDTPQSLDDESPPLETATSYRCLDNSSVKYLKLHHCNDEFVCDACKELAARPIPKDQAPDLPYAACTSELGCRCWYSPVILNKSEPQSQKVVYKDKNVTITREGVTFTAGSPCALNELASVSLEEIVVTGNRALATIISIFGLAFIFLPLLCGLLGVIEIKAITLLSMGLGAIMVIIAGLIVPRPKKTYGVEINKYSERFIPLKSEDKDYVQKIVNTISQVLQQHRAKVAAEARRERLKRERDLTEMDKLSVSELAERVMEVFRRDDAKVQIEAGRKNRCTLNIQTSSGERYVAIVKRTFQPIGLPEVRALYGLIMNSNAQKGFFFTNETFTQPAIDWAQGKSIHLVNENDLVDLAAKFGVEWE